MTVSEGSWGMYPKSSFSGLGSFFVGPVEGGIQNDLARQKDLGLTVEVTPEQYNKVLRIRDKWGNKPYELKKSDCLSFVIEAAESLGMLILPQRAGYLNFPDRYVEELIRLNSTRHSTLFLFDLSGSMSESGSSGFSKFEEAKAAAWARTADQIFYHRF